MSEANETALPPEEEKRPFQFGLRKLFLVTFIWAIFCAVTSTFGMLSIVLAAGICTSSTGIIFVLTDREVSGTWLIGIGLLLACLGRFPIGP